MTISTQRTKTRRRGPNVWVVRYGRRFTVKEEKHSVFLLPPTTQQVAIGVARELARANSSELIVQRRNGRIRLRDSYGPDHFPPRG